MKKYLDTYRELLLRPKNVVDGFVFAEKREYMHPFLFSLAGAAGVVILLVLFTDVSVDPGTTEPDIPDEELRTLAVWIESARIRAATQLLPLMMIGLLIPSLSLTGLFFFREEMESFYSNLILNTCLTGIIVIPLVLIIPVAAAGHWALSDPVIHTLMPATLTVVGGLWVYKQYLHPARPLEWIRIISSCTSGYLLFYVLNGFVAGIAGYMGYAIRRLMELSAG